MNDPLPYPWQVGNEITGDTTPDLIRKYDHAMAHFHEAEKAGQRSVSIAWKRLALEAAEQVLLRVKEEMK